jgi:peptidoglycan/xylan/chitin deacetylase (PgdA/CDA1 family)
MENGGKFKEIEEYMKPLSLSVRKILYTTAGKFSQNETRQKGPFVLCYHSISNDNWRHSISLETFVKQIDYLSARYKPTTFSDISKIIRGEIPNPIKPVFVINFDDGYKNIMLTKEYLKNMNIKPVLFLLAKPELADQTELKNTIEFLTIDEVKSLISDGWEIGSHGITHKDFWTLTPEEIENEVIESKKILEQTYGINIKYFSYPRGRYSKEIVEAVKKAGYELGVSMDDGDISVGTNPYVLPRIGIDKTHEFDEFKLTMLEPVVQTRKFIKNFAGGIVRNYI